MRVFNLPDGYVLVCRSERTRYGFRHLASLTHGYEIAHAKACYYNRTWESYQFQSVAHEVLDKAFSDEVAAEYKKLVDEQGRGGVRDTFKAVAAVAKLGEILCERPEDKNSWKQRMLKAGLSGVSFPDDFDSLPEEEKERRLNAAIESLTENK
jgi:hypothetical protein